MVVTRRDIIRIEKDRKALWAETRRNFKLDRLEVRHQSGVAPCLHAIEAYDLDHPCPVGVVWWRWGMGLEEIDILNSYTFPDLRRLGIRTHLQWALIRRAKPKVLITGRESTVDGIRWMQDFGYVLDEDRLVWCYRVES